MDVKIIDAFSFDRASKDVPLCTVLLVDPADGPLLSLTAGRPLAVRKKDGTTLHRVFIRIDLRSGCFAILVEGTDRQGIERGDVLSDATGEP